MKKTLTLVVAAALSVLFVVGCTADKEAPETPAETPVETPAETPEEPAEEPAEEKIAINNMLEKRELTEDEAKSLEKVVSLMRAVEDTVQVSVFNMTEIEGGFNIEFILKNNFKEKTVVEKDTVILITTQNDEVIEIPVPADIEIEANGGAIFEAEVVTDKLTARRDIYFIEFKAEDTAE